MHTIFREGTLSNLSQPKFCEGNLNFCDDNITSRDGNISFCDGNMNKLQAARHTQHSPMQDRKKIVRKDWKNKENKCGVPL